MDLREKKTQRSIKNAFLQLRKKKSLERITVKELCEIAEISKATFYLHYHDIYDLSETLQHEVMQDVLDSIPHPEAFLSDRRLFIQELFQAFYAQQTLIDTLFSGTQASVLSIHIEQKLKEFIRRIRPDMDRRYEVTLTYHIQGAHYVYLQYRNEYDLEEIIDMIVSEQKI